MPQEPSDDLILTLWTLNGNHIDEANIRKNIGLCRNVAHAWCYGHPSQQIMEQISDNGLVWVISTSITTGEQHFTVSFVNSSGVVSLYSSGETWKKVEDPWCFAPTHEQYCLMAAKRWFFEESNMV